MAPGPACDRRRLAPRQPHRGSATRARAWTTATTERRNALERARCGGVRSLIGLHPLGLPRRVRATRRCPSRSGLTAP